MSWHACFPRRKGNRDRCSAHEGRFLVGKSLWSMRNCSAATGVSPDSSRIIGINQEVLASKACLDELDSPHSSKRKYKSDSFGTRESPTEGDTSRQAAFDFSLTLDSALVRERDAQLGIGTNACSGASVRTRSTKRGMGTAILYAPMESLSSYQKMGECESRATLRLSYS